MLSWLTSCYLESHLPEPLNPLVTHNNKKLGRLLLECRQGGGALVGVWEGWFEGFILLSAGAQVQVHGSSCGSFGLMENFNTVLRLR